MLVTAFILFFVFLMLGVPIAFSLGLGSVVAIFMDDKISSMLVAQKLFSSINSFSLMAIPFFYAFRRADGGRGHLQTPG